jgi:hypothetical protein
MPSLPLVFLDTNVLKASLDKLPVFLARREKVTWGDQSFEVDIHEPAFFNQNAILAQRNQDQFESTVALRYLAAFAKEQKIRLITHNEVLIELWGLPNSTGGKLLYGAPITKVPGPFPYGRIVFDGTNDDHRYSFLSRIEHSRFHELQRICGAYQGAKQPLNKNQLCDAFHILCAESASANFFLTLDRKLIKSLYARGKKSTSVTPITPKDLLIELILRHPSWLWSFWREKRRIKKTGWNAGSKFQTALDDPKDGA